MGKLTSPTWAEKKGEGGGRKDKQVLSSRGRQAGSSTLHMTNAVHFADAELGNIPATQLLAGLGQFDPTEQDNIPKLVAQLMSELKGKIEGPKTTPTMVATGEGLTALPKKFWQESSLTLLSFHLPKEK